MDSYQNTTNAIISSHFMTNVCLFVPELTKNYIPKIYYVQKRKNYDRKIKYINFLFYLHSKKKLYLDIKEYLQIVPSSSYTLLVKFNGEKQKTIIGIVVNNEIQDEVSKLLIKFHKDEL